MSNPRYEIVHGKRILVQDYDGDDADNVVPIKPTSKKPKPKEFAKMELALIAAAAKAAGIPGAAVLVLLRYMAWKAGGQTFPLSNTLFTRYGISRHVKYRVLANLEKAGWIRIERRGAKKSPLITLLKPLG